MRDYMRKKCQMQYVQRNTSSQNLWVEIKNSDPAIQPKTKRVM